MDPLLLGLLDTATVLEKVATAAITVLTPALLHALWRGTLYLKSIKKSLESIPAVVKRLDQHEQRIAALEQAQAGGTPQGGPPA